VDFALGVAVDADHPLREVHIGCLLGVGVAVQEVLIVNEGLLALGGASIIREVHSRARAALWQVAHWVIGTAWSARAASAALLRPGHGDVVRLERPSSA